jgi:glutamate/tyrosine decarboxylase-like PLP-dependent enzyme
VVANSNIAQQLPEAWHSAPVRISPESLSEYPGIRLVEADVVAEENRYRHDPQKLAATIMRLYDGRDSFTLDPPRPAPEERPLMLTR